MLRNIKKQITAVIVLGLVFAFVFFFSQLTQVSANNTIYYVSPSGNDSNNGTSTSTPWKTLSKVSNTNFAPGDQILFQCGGVWSGQLFIHNSGSSGSPIKFGSYGSGNKPLFNGGGIYATVWLYNTSYVTVENLAVTNYDGASVYDLKEDGRAGIRIDNGNGTVTSNITIKNNEVYYIEGWSNSRLTQKSPRGTSDDYNNKHYLYDGAIYNTSTASVNLLIDGNYVHDCTTQGIFAAGSNTGLIIQNNTVDNVGCDGIQYYANAPLIQYNKVTNVGNNSGTAARGPGVLGYGGIAVAGIWGAGTTDQVVQYNYCANTNNIAYDGQAWDFDINTTRGVYQYNFSRDNEGGFILGSIPGQICRYNISYNDGSNMEPSQGFFGGGGTAGEFYNNVFYQNNGAGFLKNITGGVFKNNIFYTNSTNTSRTNYKSSSGLTFSNNCFAGGQTAYNMGDYAVAADPLLVNPTSVGTTINSVDGMKLQAGSPCINTGTVIPNNGGKDYWGNTLYNGTPDIGAHEYTGTVPSGGDARSGSWAAKAVVGSTPSYNNFYQTVTGVPTNTSYTGSFWLKGSGKITLRILSSGWSMIAEQEYTATSTWTQYTLPTFNTDSNTTLIYDFTNKGNVAGTMFIDDCYFGTLGGTNKLTNSGFESGTGNWTSDSTAVFSIFQATNPNVHAGTWSARANTTTSWDTLYQNISSVPTNTSYVNSFWLKGSGKIRIRVFNSSWSTMIAEQEFTATSTWTQYTTPAYNTGSNTSLVYVFTDSGTGTMYIDDCFMGPSGGTNKLSNPGFESGNSAWTVGGTNNIYTILQP